MVPKRPYRRSLNSPLDHFLVGFDDDFQGLLAFPALYFFVHLAAFPDAISPALDLNLNRPFGRLCRLVAQSRAIEGCRCSRMNIIPSF
jgi:hypothetical protein